MWKVDQMLKTQLRLPTPSGTYSFRVVFSKPIDTRQAIFVIRPLGWASDGSESDSSLIWSELAGGYFLYSPQIVEPQVLISSRFTLDLPTPEVEIEVLPWAGADLEDVVESISLISRPTKDDPVFTTYIERKS